MNREKFVRDLSGALYDTEIPGNYKSFQTQAEAITVILEGWGAVEFHRNQESGVQMRSTYNFSTALEQLKAGYAVAREGWNSRGMYLEIQSPDGKAPMTLPYIYIETEDGDLVPWVATQPDILSNDWMTVI